MNLKVKVQKQSSSIKLGRTASSAAASMKSGADRDCFLRDIDGDAGRETGNSNTVEARNPTNFSSTSDTTIPSFARSLVLSCPNCNVLSLHPKTKTLLLCRFACHKCDFGICVPTTRVRSLPEIFRPRIRKSCDLEIESENLRGNNT